MAPLDDPEDHHRLLRLATASGALTTRTGTGRGQQLDAYAAGRGLKDAMAAALRTDDRVHGLLLVGGRLGDVTTFTSSDLALLDTFARHVATSLERGRLEENLRQVTDLKEQLRHQALHDPLTGLPNRTLFLDRVAARRRHRRRAPGCGRPCSTWTSTASSRSTTPSATRPATCCCAPSPTGSAAACARPTPPPASVVTSSSCCSTARSTGSASPASSSASARSSTSRSLLGEGVVTTVGASIGVALGDPTTPDADTLVRHADIAMYAAKRSLGSDFLVYEPGLGDTHRHAQGLRGRAGRGDPQRRDAHGLPAADRHAHRPADRRRGARPLAAPGRRAALARPVHRPGRGQRPDHRDRRAWCSTTRATRPPAGSPRRPTTPTCWSRSTCRRARSATTQIVDQVRAALDASGLEPHRLVLEITETVLMHDRDAAAATLWQLKGLGVRIAIDDFGTGYSSLAYLRRFPIDMLKVAREFVDGLGRDAHDDVITRAIVELANTLGLLTVAEGIETTQQSETAGRAGLRHRPGLPVLAPDRGRRGQRGHGRAGAGRPSAAPVDGRRGPAGGAGLGELTAGQAAGTSPAASISRACSRHHGDQASSPSASWRRAERRPSPAAPTPPPRSGPGAGAPVNRPR